MIESNDAINAKGSFTPEKEILLMSARTLTPKEIALDWGTTGKTLRKFLRSDDSGIQDLAPGKGGRWAIPASRLKTLNKRFLAWKAAQAEEARKRREALAATEATESDTSPVEDEVLESTDEVEVLDSDEVLIDE